MLVCTVRCSFPSPFQLRGPLATSVLRSGKSRADHSASPRVSQLASFAGSGALPQLFQDLIHAEASGSLARREFFERGEELPDDALRRHTDIGMVHPPVVIRVRRDVCPFIRIRPQIEELRKPQRCERFLPYL